MAGSAKQRIEEIWRTCFALLHTGKAESYLECGEGTGVTGIVWIERINGLENDRLYANCYRSMRI